MKIKSSHLSHEVRCLKQNFLEIIFGKDYQKKTLQKIYEW